MTLIATLTAIPIVGAAGMAIDYARISRVHDEIQYIADGASLFAAGAKTLGGTLADKRATRVKLATSYLDSALGRITDAKILGAPTIVADDMAINIEVKAEVKGSLTNIFGMLKESADIENGRWRRHGQRHEPVLCDDGEVEGELEASRSTTSASWR